MRPCRSTLGVFVVSQDFGSVGANAYLPFVQNCGQNSLRHVRSVHEPRTGRLVCPPGPCPGFKLMQTPFEEQAQPSPQQAEKGAVVLQGTSTVATVPSG